MLPHQRRLWKRGFQLRAIRPPGDTWKNLDMFLVVRAADGKILPVCGGRRPETVFSTL